MNQNRLMAHESSSPIRMTPEALRLIHLANFKEKVRLQKLASARKALAICNKLKPSDTKARHVSRIFSAINKLRAA